MLLGGVVHWGAAVNKDESAIDVLVNRMIHFFSYKLILVSLVVMAFMWLKGRSDYQVF